MYSPLKSYFRSIFPSSSSSSDPLSFSCSPLGGRGGGGGGGGGGDRTEKGDSYRVFFFGCRGRGTRENGLILWGTKGWLRRWPFKKGRDGGRATLSLSRDDQAKAPKRTENRKERFFFYFTTGKGGRRRRIINLDLFAYRRSRRRRGAKKTLSFLFFSRIYETAFTVFSHISSYS